MTSKTTEPRGGDTWHFDKHRKALRQSIINRRAWQLFRDWWRFSFTDEAVNRRGQWTPDQAYEACLKTAKIVTILEQETPSPSSTDGSSSSNAPTKEPSSPKTP